MMIVLSSLLACAPASDTGAPETSSPTWEGTQIGEEGDLLCTYDAGDWDAEAEAASDWDPGALPAEGAWRGTLAETDLTVTLSASGAPLALLPPADKTSFCPTGVRQPVTLTFSAPPLLEVTTSAVVDATEHVVLFAEIDEAELSGTLDPGTLPDDAGALHLELSAYFEAGWSGRARWILARPSGTEESPVGDWDAE